MDPKHKFEKELQYFLNEKKFEIAKKDTEKYRYPPIVHIQNKLNPNILDDLPTEETRSQLSSLTQITC